MQNFSCLGWLKLLNYTFPGGRPAKPEINANLSPAWSAGAWAELGNKNQSKIVALNIVYFTCINLHQRRGSDFKRLVKITL